MPHKMGLRELKQKIVSANQYLLAAILISVIWSIIVLWPHLFDWYRVPIDEQTFYWMAKFQDPTLFPNEKFGQLVDVELFSRSIVLYPISLGYSVLFYLASFFVEPILFSKILGFFLLPLSLIYVFKLIKSISKSDKTAFVVSVLFVFYNLASPDSMAMASGLQRAFALVFIISYLYFLREEKYSRIAFLLPLIALIYMPTLPLIVSAYLFTFLEINNNFVISIKWQKEKMFSFLAGIVLASLIALWGFIVNHQLHISADVNTLTHDTSIFRNPTYQQGGTTPIYSFFPWVGRAGLFELNTELLNFLVLLFLGILIYFFVDEKERYAIPFEFKSLLKAGFLLYFMSLSAIFFFNSFVLYMPSRYTRTILFFVVFCFVGLNLEKLIQQILKKIQGRLKTIILIGIAILGIFAFLIALNWIKTIFWLGLGFWGVVLTIFLAINVKLFVHELKKESFDFFQLGVTGFLLLLLVFPAVKYSRLVGFGTINPTENERDLYSYVSTLPKDVTLAGSPEELTGIPLFAQRSVLFKDLRPSKSAPVIDFFDAYYAENPQDVLTFCMENEVDYLVYNTADYEIGYLKAGDFFYKPYNKHIREIVEYREEFIIPQAKKEFLSGQLGVIKCSFNSFEMKQGNNHD